MTEMREFAPRAAHRTARECLYASAFVGMCAVGLAACDTPSAAQAECRPVNGSDVCVWGESAGDTLVAFGATVPFASVENAPADAPMAWPPVAAAVIPLPQSVSSATGFKVVTIFWEPHGHPPGPYLTPHFDFHFNTISAAELDAIDCSDSTKPPQTPTSYFMPDVSIPQIGDLKGLCVPKMGMHALPGTELNSPTGFEKALVVGYYRGQPIFVEPMVSRTTLLERQSFSLIVPDVPGRPAQARYPTRFRADYDSAAKAYRFVFSDFTGK